MIERLRVWQVTLVGPPPKEGGPDVAVAALRSASGGTQVTIQVDPSSAPSVGDSYELDLRPLGGLGAQGLEPMEGPPVE